MSSILQDEINSLAEACRKLSADLVKNERGFSIAPAARVRRATEAIDELRDRFHARLLPRLEARLSSEDNVPLRKARDSLVNLLTSDLREVGDGTQSNSILWAANFTVIAKRLEGLAELTNTRSGDTVFHQTITGSVIGAVSAGNHSKAKGSAKAKTTTSRPRRKG